MENIVPIITICVTLLLGVGGFVVNSLIQRKSNSIQIITKTRLERRAETKRIMAALDKYSDFTFLNSVIKSCENEKAIRELVTDIAKLRSEYTYTWGNDRDLCESAFALKDAIVDYLGNPDPKHKDELKYRRKIFLKITDVYMQTEWKRIKYETVGKQKKLRQSFNETFESYESDYKDR